MMIDCLLLLRVQNFLFFFCHLRNLNWALRWERNWTKSQLSQARPHSSSTTQKAPFSLFLLFLHFLTFRIKKSEVLFSKIFETFFLMTKFCKQPCLRSVLFWAFLWQMIAWGDPPLIPKLTFTSLNFQKDAVGRIDQNAPLKNWRHLNFLVL